MLTARPNPPLPEWQAYQTELLELSSNSRQLFAEKSSHQIEFEQPQAPVAAILKMVDLVRQAPQK